MFVLFTLIIREAFSECLQSTYRLCMDNTPNDYCYFSKESNKCFDSKSTNFGCLNTLNKNLCLLQDQQFSCYYQDQCRDLKESLLLKINCTQRAISKGACFRLQNYICTWNENKNICEDFTQPPINTEDCSNQYHQEGFPIQVTALACSQITSKKCISNRINDLGGFNKNFVCSSSFDPNTANCNDLGISKPACLSIITPNQLCQYDKIDAKCTKNCPYKCQNVNPTECRDNLNQNACLSMQNIQCQYDGVCKNIQITNQICNLRNVTQQVCQFIKSTPCHYNLQTRSCLEPDTKKLTCEELGLNKKGCYKSSYNCIYTNKCRILEDEELNQILCSDIITKSACLSIKTEFQLCQWDDEIGCQLIEDIQSQSCKDLKLVNGNACKQIQNQPCKYDQKEQSCILALTQDICETSYLNLQGCIQITRISTACQWIDNQCQKAVIDSSKPCETLQLSNSITCSQYFALVSQKEFQCYVYDNNFQFGNLTCRFDPVIQGCRQLTNDEYSTLQCGDDSLGLNKYACSLIKTQLQICRFSNSRCTKFKENELFKKTCSSLEFVNPRVCAYNIMDDQPCKFDISTCKCTSQVDYKKDDCLTLGMNNSACSGVTRAQCYFSTKINEAFQCKQKDSDDIVNSLECKNNKPSKELCLAIQTKNQSCKWVTMGQYCNSISVDQNQNCAYYQQVNQQVCQQIMQKDPNPYFKGYCYYSSPNCYPWKENKECTKTCCTDIIGINIHVCSRMTNFDNKYCYFDDLECKEYPTPNQQSLERIQNQFKNKNCENFNYQMCGKINPDLTDLDKLNLCYQSSSNDRCYNYTYVLYKLITDKTQFLAESVRVNKWICKMIDQPKLYVQYRYDLGRCLKINQNINCWTPDINKQACLELTQDSFCIWQSDIFECQQVQSYLNLNCNSLINKNTCLMIDTCRYNIVEKKCELLQIIDSSISCTSLAGNYLYNSLPCTKISDGSSCSYDFKSHVCQLQTKSQIGCFILGQNRQSCLLNTQGLCQWDESSKSCVDILIQNITSCSNNLNKNACLKVSSYACSFDTQCKTITYNPFATCSELVSQTKMLLRYFNEIACTQIDLPGQLCGFNSTTFTCFNETLDNKIQIENFTCTQFPMNIHLCLSYTRGSLCQFINQKCEFLVYSGEINSCEFPNLSRDVCLLSSAKCRYNKFLSKCETVPPRSGDQPAFKCSEFKPDGQFLFSKQNCISIRDPLQLRFENLYAICNSNICDMEKYCMYNATIQGCQIINYGQPSYTTNEWGQQICSSGKDQLSVCDSIYNYHICLELVDGTCKFDLGKGGCSDYTISDYDDYNCTDVNSNGCLFVSKLGQQCFVQNITFFPQSCNSAVQQYQICSPYSQLVYSTQKWVINQTITYYNYSCDFFDNFIGLLVNPNLCSAVASGSCKYSDDKKRCETFNYSLYQCNIVGLSKGGCSSYFCDYDQTNKKCVNKNQQVVTTPNCSSIFTYDNQSNTETDIQYSKQCSQQGKFCAYYYFNLVDTQYFNIPQCEQCNNTAYQLYNSSVAACQTPYNLYPNCGNLKNDAYCSNSCTVKKVATSTRPCNSTYYADYQLNCTCISDNYNTCMNSANQKLEDDKLACKKSDFCQLIRFQCVLHNGTTNAQKIIQNYQRVPYDLCIGALGIPLYFDLSDYRCLQVTDQLSYCSYLNYDACVGYTGRYGELYCVWDRSCKTFYRSQDLKSINNCSSVNSNSCYYIAATCSLDPSTRLCKPQSQVGSCKTQYITSDYTCQNLFTSDQCYFDIQLSRCLYLPPSNESYLFDCNQQGLNKAACYLNTKQYCTYDESCNQINDLSNSPCENLNKRACLEHFVLACIWDLQLKKCTQVKFIENQTCDRFQEKVTSFQVNQLTCQQIQSVPCMYQFSTKSCITPTQEFPCQQYAFNQKACVQSTKGFCQYRAALLDSKNDDLPIYQYCDTLGNYNIDCSTNLNKYSCSSALLDACIFINNMCSQFEIDTNDYLNQITKNYLSPFICQNTNINKIPLIFNNYVCNQVNSKIYTCDTLFINMETCLGYTNEYCQYSPGLQNYNDQQMRCLGYDEGLLFQQICDQYLNYKICSNVINDACVFKNNRCVDFDPNVDTCQTLSQNDIYASIQSCVQTNDQYCQFDYTNKRCIQSQQLATDSFECNRQDINKNYCLASTKSCQFTIQSVRISKNGDKINIYICTYAILDNYTCTDQISQSSCLQLKGCKFQDMKCQQTSEVDRLQCLKNYKIEGTQCALVTDIPCGYDTISQTCIRNTNLFDENIQYLNNLACQQSLLNKPLIYTNNQCQSANSTLNYQCTDKANLNLCINIKSLDQFCIFNGQCQNYTSNKCLDNKNINKPDICSKTIDIPCKFYNNNCVQAQNLESESTEQGLNTLACLQSNLQQTKQCENIVIQANCDQVNTQEQCMRLVKACQWTTQCSFLDTTNLKCDSINVKVNQQVCQQIDMSYKIGYQCEYNSVDLNCKSVVVNSCENIYQKIPCLLIPYSTKLSCIWIQNQQKCQTYFPKKNLDDCKSQIGNIVYCKRVVKLGSQCEFIDQQCQIAKFKQTNWWSFINQEACLLQKSASCYWEQECLCQSGQDLQKFITSQNCTDNLSFLTCTQVQTINQFCQFYLGQCRSLVKLSQVSLLQYSQINSNICKLVTDYPAAYDPLRFVCYKVQQFDDCNKIGLNKLACVSDLTKIPCMWQDNKCQPAKNYTNKKLRILQSNNNTVNPSTCFLSNEPVYYENGACVQVNSQTPCTALGLSEAGCYQTTKSPCLWDDEIQECQDYEPFQTCLEIPKKVNSIVCKSVDIDPCYYNIQDRSCQKISFDDGCQKCPFKSCNFNSKQCVSPELPGLNMIACVQMEGYQFKDQCEPANKGSNCSNYPFVHPLVCSYSYEDCVYDQISKNCDKIDYSEKCYQYGLSLVGCKMLGCDIIKNQCQCKQLTSLRCQYSQKVDCDNNNLCFWQKDSCKPLTCGGITTTDSLSSRQQCALQYNCYTDDKNCIRADSCENIQFYSKDYNSCWDILINERPCIFDGRFKCKTLICSDLQRSLCITNPLSNYCYWSSTGCEDIKCSNITDSQLCYSKKICYPMLNNQCVQFNQCSSVNYYDGSDQKDIICQSISQLLDNNKYVPCGWDYDYNSCINNPCSKLGIDSHTCNGVHLNNQYVCVLSKELICTVCEQFIQACDCLDRKYCEWNDDRQVCNSIPCERIYNVNLCQRSDCFVFELTNGIQYCKTRCQYHLGQNYCQKFNCVWNIPQEKCEECDHKTCELRQVQGIECEDTQCCQYKLNRCAPVCERLSQTFCIQTNDCDWDDFLELCIWKKEPIEQIPIANINQSEKKQQESKQGFILIILIILY